MLGISNYFKLLQGASGRRLSERRWVQFVKCHQEPRVLYSENLSLESEERFKRYDGLLGVNALFELG